MVWDKHQDNGISARESSEPSQQLGGHWHHLKRKREVEQEGWDGCQDSKNLYLFSIQCCASCSDSRKTTSSLISCNQGPSSSHETTTTKGKMQQEPFRFRSKTTYRVGCVKEIEYSRKGDLGEVKKMYSSRVLVEKQVNFSKFANS